VQKYAVFQDAGYKGLYGMGVSAIKARKTIPSKEDLLDHAGRAELAANEFRITQTEQKLNRERIQGEESAIQTHHSVGREVRATIQKIGGTMPEDLPPEPSIKKLKTQRKKQLKSGPKLLT
jgi:DNA-damage-inducible protein D